MTFWSFIILLIACLLTASRSAAQRNYIQAFAIGVPFQSGAGIGNIGFEHLNKERNSSWQFAFNAAGGSLATDVAVPHRIWGTIDKMITLNKKTVFTNAPFLSFFLEVGKRRLSGGRLFPENGSILQSTDAFEINPGIGIGRNFSLGKKWHMQILAAPKLIFSFRKDQYFETASGTLFYNKYNEVSGGYRILFNFCYPLGK
jgi:hypothetical protein